MTDDTVALRLDEGQWEGGGVLGRQYFGAGRCSR
jgi:hypothetical protein